MCTGFVTVVRFSFLFFLVRCGAVWCCGIERVDGGGGGGGKEGKEGGGINLVLSVLRLHSAYGVAQRR